MSRAGLLILAAACSGSPSSSSGPGNLPGAPTSATSSQLLAVSAFAAIGDPGLRSQALFVEVSRVLTHPRCVNCHPPDDTPRQGDLHVFHDPPVVRGAADRGVPAMQCTTCHQDRNVELARVPGAPGWHLAPRSMVWLDKTPAQICGQIKDLTRNGGKSLAQLQDHVAHDALVGWGFDPGADRLPAPGTQAQAGELIQAWIETGAVCPPDDTGAAK